MIGHEENQEDVSFKVTDRRKFNPDGSVREGVVIDEPKPAPAAAPETKTAAAPAKAAPELPPESAAEVDDESEDDDIPGADDPASFVNFLSTLATNAAASLGAVPHPATGQRTVDLDTGKYWLDVLGHDPRQDKRESSPAGIPAAGRPARRPADAVRDDGPGDGRKAEGTGS